MLGAGYVVLLMLILSFLILPIVVVCISAFDSRSYLGYFPPPGFSLRWFRYVAASEYFLEGAKTSLLVTAVSTVVAVIAGLLAALAIVRVEFGGKVALITFFMSPVIVPGVVTGFALLTYFSAIGLTAGYVKLWIAHSLLAFPYCLRTCLASLSGFNRELEDAAINLGCRPIHAFFLITIPLIRPGLVAATVFAVSVSFDDVAVTIFLTDPFAYTLPIAVLSSLKARWDPSVAVVSVVGVIVAIIVVVVVERVTGVEKFIGMSLGRAG